MADWLRWLGNMVVPDICPLCRNELSNPAVKLCDECFEQFAKLPEKRCPGCGGPADALMAQCRECLSGEERPWQIAVSAFAFEGLARTAVHCLKYRGRRELAPFFARQMAENWRKYSMDFHPDVIAPVPLHWWRWLVRGYNQADEVAQFLGKDLGIPVASLLRRTRYTRPQAKLAAKARQANLKTAFRAKKDVKGMNILLVDDVFTTGATLTAAANALLKKKAKAVAVITIARDL